MLRHIPKNVKAKMQVLYKFGFADLGMIALFAIAGVALGYLLFAITGKLAAWVLSVLILGGAGIFLTLDMPMFNESVLSRLKAMYRYATSQKLYFYAHGKDQDQQTGNSTQAKINIKDIRNGLIHRKDGSLVAIVQIMPFNLNLLSESEQNRKIKELESVLTKLEMPFQVMAISRPTDLSQYKHHLQQLKEHTIDPMKKELLRFYADQTERVVNNGQAMERQFFVILSAKPIKKEQLVYVESELMQKAFDLTKDLKAIKLPASMMLDQDLRELLMIFFHPSNQLEAAPEVNWKMIITRGDRHVV